MSKTALILAFSMLLSFASKAQTVLFRTNLSTAELKELQIIGLQENGKRLIPFFVTGDTVRFDAKGFQRVQLMQANYESAIVDVREQIGGGFVTMKLRNSQLGEVSVSDNWRQWKTEKTGGRLAWMNRWMIMAVPVDLSQWRTVKSIRLRFKHLQRSDTVELRLYNNRQAVFAQAPLTRLKHFGKATFTMFDRETLEVLPHPVSVSPGDTLLVEIRINNPIPPKQNAFI